MPCAEVGALGGALTIQDKSGLSAALVSVKSVYGHTEGAAGKLPSSVATGTLPNLLQLTLIEPLDVLQRN